MIHPDHFPKLVKVKTLYAIIQWEILCLFITEFDKATFDQVDYVFLEKNVSWFVFVILFSGLVTIIALVTPLFILHVLNSYKADQEPSVPR